MIPTNQNKVGPLNWQVPIVTKEGQPTNEFMRQWSAQAETNKSIPALNSAAAASALIDYLGSTQGDLLYRGAAQWSVLAPATVGNILQSGGAGANPSWATVSELLDSISNVQGTLLYRGAAAWSGLAPGTAGQFLETGGAGANPLWSAPSSSGLILGSGAPTALEPAGTVYSRTDQEGLYSSQPTSSAGGIVQHASFIENAGIPGSVTITSAPTPGNLLLAFIAYGNNDHVLPTINTSAWTLFETIAGTGGNITGFAVYRYAQAGDTSALPALCTAGSAYWAAAIYELSGVTGTFATDVPLSEGSYVNGGSLTSTAQLSTVNGQIAILATGQYDGNVSPTFSAGWTLDESAHNSSFFGSVGAAHEVVATSGTSVSGTVTTGGGFITSLFQVLVTVATVTTANWDMIEEVPTGGTTGQALVKNSNTNFDTKWATLGGSGTVTSVGLAMPSIFTVSGSPVIAAGTLTAVLNAQNANLVFSGPGTGAAAIPTFRALVAADIPALSYAPSALASGDIFVGSAGGVATAVAMSQDATVVASGAVTVVSAHGAFSVGTILTVPVGTEAAPPINFSGTTSGFHYDAATLLSGVNSVMVDVGGVGLFSINSGGAIMPHNSADNQPGEFGAWKSRGTLAAPTVVATNDQTLLLSGRGYGNTNYQYSAGIRFRVIDTTPSDTAMGGQIEFSTSPIGGNSLGQIAQFNSVSAYIKTFLAVGSATTPTHALEVTGAALASTYMNVGSLASPTNTTAGDLTSTRAFITSKAKFGGTGVPAQAVDVTGQIVTTAQIACGTALTQQSTRVVPVTGFSATIGTGVVTYYMNPAGTLATGTLIFPTAANCINGQHLIIATTQTISTLTLTPGSGTTIGNAPATLLAGTSAEWQYNSTDTLWFRLR